MSEVTFEESVEARHRPQHAAPRGGLSALVIRSGLASTDAAAQKVLGGVFVVLVIATALVLLSGGSKTGAGGTEGEPPLFPETAPH